VELGAVLKKLIEDPKADLDTDLTHAMGSLAERLNLTLG
jgi:hypothetical protein